MTGWFIERLGEWAASPALVWNDVFTSYEELIALKNQWRETLLAKNISHGSVVGIDANFSPNAVALLLALMQENAIAVPLTPLVRAQRGHLLEIAQASLLIELDDRDQATHFDLPYTASHPLFQRLLEREHPGLVIFSSGSTGTPKAILHDLCSILEKFDQKRQRKNTLAFLLFDHIGGIDTLLNTLSNGGTLITIPSREPEVVARAIAAHNVQTLPASPTFLRLFLMSGAWQHHDLSCLRVIAYGTEPMPESTLAALREAFPEVALVQTYGMSELGVLRSKSKDSGSLWLKFTEEGFRTKVVDGVLWVKADAAMLGYLNADALFDEEGWLNTQDAVEVNEGYFRVLGRVTDLINVGGQKVYPAEVEAQLLQMDNVDDVLVFGKANALMGQMVAARFRLKAEEPLAEFKSRLHAFCRPRLAAYQIPRWVELTREAQFGHRFKKRRTAL